MQEAVQQAPVVGREARTFQRVDVPAFGGFEVALGPLGKPPTHSKPIDISRGGLKTRTGVSFFEGAEGMECLVRFRDASGRLTPDRTLGWVRRVEESAGYYLVSIEFSHPLERLSF